MGKNGTKEAHAPAGLLGRVRTGKQHRPYSVVVWGVPGVGKSTFAAGAPDPIFYCLERGAELIDVPKLDPPQRRGPLTEWESFLEDVHSLATEPHTYKSLVLDTLDALEALTVRHVCEKGNKQTLSDFDWGKGQVATADQWRLLLKGLEALRDQRGMNIILIAHEHRKPFADPTIGTYDCYRPKLLDRVWSLTNEWAECVMFAEYETAILEKKDERVKRGIVTGERVLRTSRGTGYIAKNRYSLPATLPLSWEAFDEAARAASAGVEELRAVLKSKLDELADEAIDKKASEFLMENGVTVHTLREAIASADKYLSARRTSAA